MLVERPVPPSALGGGQHLSLSMRAINVLCACVCACCAFLTLLVWGAGWASPTGGAGCGGGSAASHPGGPALGQPHPGPCLPAPIPSRGGHGGWRGPARVRPSGGHAPCPRGSCTGSGVPCRGWHPVPLTRRGCAVKRAWRCAPGPQAALAGPGLAARASRGWWRGWDWQWWWWRGSV